MWKIIRVIQVAVVALLLTVSCTEDPMDGGGGLYDKEYVDFTMELQPPGGYTPAESRAMTDNEQNAINSATVLVYNSADQTLLYHVQGSVSANKLTVKLKTSQKESDIFDVVVIGNPPADFNPTAGQTKAVLQSQLNRTPQGIWRGTEFMMWGERKNTLIKPTTNNFKIEMLRSLARIDVGVGTYNPATDTWSGLTDFVLTEVRVVNRRDKFAVIPLPENVNTEGKVKVTAPSIPEGTSVIGKTADDALKYSGGEIQNGAYINSTIFVAEAPNTPGNERVTLIIGGRYNGTANYYRVDMCLPKKGGEEGFDYLPILRNHRYRITITGIGVGAANAADALKSDPINKWVTFEPISESEGGSDIVSDGYNYIETDVSEVQIYGKPDGLKKYDLFTVKTDSKAGIPATGTVTGPGISGGSLTLTNGASQLVNAAIPAGAGPHTYTITLGTLQKIINVTVAPLEGFSTALPFIEVASITTEGGEWLTLSHNATYVQGEQQSGFIEGNAQGKAYMHFTENLSSKGATRTAKAIVTHNNSRGTTRVILEQRKNEIVGYFGGDPGTPVAGDGTMYPTQLVVASAEILNKQYKTANTENASSIVNSIYYGRNMNIAAAALSGEETLANYPAFEYCAGLNKDLDGNGTIDDSEMIWYLPSQNQLMAMYVFDGGLDIQFVADSYWSTWQGSTGNARYVGFNNGRAGGKGKNSPIRVRCVRDL